MIYNVSRRSLFDSIAMTWSAIIRLLFVGCPAAILRRVAFVVVNALDGISGWTFAHVGNKGSEVIPARADGDASASIPMVVGSSLGVASGSHVVPDSVERMITHPMLADDIVSEVVVFETAAAFSPSASEAYRGDVGFCSTFADTAPYRGFAVFIVGCAGYYRETIEFLTSKVNEVWHNILHEMLFHMKGYVPADVDFGFRVAFPRHNVNYSMSCTCGRD